MKIEGLDRTNETWDFIVGVNLMSLDQIAMKHKTDKGSAWHNYCYIYERHFAKWRNVPVNLIEIGVQFGLSMATWLEYFPKAEVWGVDLNTKQCRTQDARLHLVEGDGGNLETYSEVPKDFDIVIDDGSHVLEDQMRTFEILWPRLIPGGIYAIEDVGTWYDMYFNRAGCEQAWLCNLIGDIHHHGKDYHGRPVREQSPLPLTLMEIQMASMEITKDLVIITKGKD